MPCLQSGTHGLVHKMHCRDNKGKENKHLMCRTTPAQYTLCWATTNAQLHAVPDKPAPAHTVPTNSHMWTQLERNRGVTKAKLKNITSRHQNNIRTETRESPHSSSG